MSACARCGAELPEGARFCPSCGASLAVRREERRVVTVLFGDLSGFTAMSERLDPEEVKSIVDRAFEGLAELVTLYGGRVDKVIGDEIMAVFGAPQAHEDDSERAVRCALAMQGELARFARELERERGVRLRMRIGVNTGEVVAGTVAGGESYTVVGDAVNMASRIEAAAEPGQVLVGEATYLATARAIEFREHPPVVAKGKQDPLAVWEAVAERTLPGAGRRATEAPLIGRDEELAILHALAGIVRRDRRTIVVTLLGEAGMGKTRVAQEFARRLEPEGACVLSGRSLPYGTASPSFALDEMVRAALEIDPGAPVESARARAQERLAQLGIPLEADRLLALAGLREKAAVGATGTAAGGRGDGGRGRAVAGPAGGPAASGAALQSARALFETLAAREGFLVLAFHELHWAEDTLLDFIADLAERGRHAPLLVLCLARPEFLDRAPAWAGRPGSATLTLEPLPRDRAAALLDALLGDREMDATLRDEVLERAGGNPFYLEELVRLLVDRGELGGGGDVAVPVSVHALVAARLDALPPEAKRLVQAAAVIGDHFWLDALLRLEPDLDPSDVERTVEALAAKEIVEGIEPSGILGRREFRFRQAVEREVAYASVPKQARARMHFLAGNWVEGVTRSVGLEDEFTDLIGHHYERAASLGREIGAEVEGAVEKAREFLVRAGDRALNMDAMFTAGKFFERALPFAADDRDALHLRLHLGEALVGCWRPVAAEEHLTRVLEEARRAGERGAEGKALRLLGDLNRMRGDLESARPLLDQGLEIAKEVGDAHEEVEGLRSHGLSDIFVGRYSSALLWFRQALARSRDVGDRRSEGWSLQNLAWASMILGRLDEAMKALEEGQQVFAEIGDNEGVGWCLGIRAWALFFQGRLDEADTLELQIESLVSASAEGVLGMASFGWGIGRVLRAIIAVERARLSEAESLARSALPIFEEADSDWGRAMARYPLGVVALLRRQVREAREILEEGLRYAVQDPLVHALFEAPLAWVAVEEGDLAEAERRIAASRELSERAEVSWIGDSALLWLEAEMARAAGDLERARERLERARSLRRAGLFARGYSLALLADVMCDAGEAADAVAVAREAIDESGDYVAGRLMGLNALARSLTESGKPEEGERAAREELALLDVCDWDEERVCALTQLAAALDAQGRAAESAEARASARAMIARFPLGADTAPLEEMLS